jgi:hypothetical protein
MTFNWRSYIDALSAIVQRVYSKDRVAMRELDTRGQNTRVEFVLAFPQAFKFTAQASVHDSGCSTNLPATNAQKKANDIALLLLLKFLEILEGTHGSWLKHSLANALLRRIAQAIRFQEIQNTVSRNMEFRNCRQWGEGLYRPVVSSNLEN